MDGYIRNNIRFLTIGSISFNLDGLNSIELDDKTIYVCVQKFYFKRTFKSQEDAQTTYDKLRQEILSGFPSEIILTEFYN